MPSSSTTSTLAPGWAIGELTLSNGNEAAPQVWTLDRDIRQEGGRAKHIRSHLAQRAALPGDLILRTAAAKSVHVMVAQEAIALAGRHTFRGCPSPGLSADFAAHWLLLAQPSADVVKRGERLVIPHPVATDEQDTLSRWLANITTRLDSLTLRAATIERLRRHLPMALRPPPARIGAAHLDTLRRALISTVPAP